MQEPHGALDIESGERASKEEYKPLAAVGDMNGDANTDSSDASRDSR